MTLYEMWYFSEWCSMVSKAVTSISVDPEVTYYTTQYILIVTNVENKTLIRKKMFKMIKSNGISDSKLVSFVLEFVENQL